MIINYAIAQTFKLLSQEEFYRKQVFCLIHLNILIALICAIGCAAGYDEIKICEVRLTMVYFLCCGK